MRNATSHDAPCRLGRIDPPQIAWAAGFFDGEGSTSVHEPRPGYLRLTVSVGQFGGAAPPEVLYRFGAAMLGLGEIEIFNSEGMWAWRSRSFEEGQAAIALLWRYLGPVKRQQAVDAIRRVHDQYGPGRLKPRAPRRRRPQHPTHAKTASAAISNARPELAWAAGFLDGEGTFGVVRAGKRKRAPDWYRIRASAPQKGAPGVVPDVLHRMQKILGGKIERHGDPDDYRWIVNGISGVERVLAALRPMLGTVKQAQAAIAMERFRGQLRVHGDALKCARGHEYSSTYISRTGPKQRCNACARILSRVKRAARGIKPRRFKNLARRYTF